MSHFAATLPFEDYVAASRMMFLNRWKRGALRFVAVLGLLYTLIFGLIAWDEWSLGALLESIGIGLGVAVSVMIAIIVLQWFLLPRRARKIYRQMQVEGVTTAYTFDESGLRTESPLGSSNFAWQHFVGWSDGARILLLYRTDNMIVPVPKAQVDVPTLEALKAALLNAAIPTR